MTTTDHSRRPRGVTRLGGTAPRGTWWMALRHNRSALVIVLGSMVVLAALMLWHRTALAHNYAAAGITDVRATKRSPGEPGSTSRALADRLQEIQDAYLTSFTVFRWAMGALPVLVGTVLGVTSLSREFDRRTQVFALTQSVSVSRWWATKVVVGVLPLAAGFAALGFLFRSTANTWGVNEWKALDAAQLISFGWLPAAIFVLSFCAGVAVSSLIRSSMPALLVGIVLSVGMLGLLLTQYTSLAPSQRLVDPELDYSLALPVGALQLTTGLQNAAGENVVARYSCPALDAANAANPNLEYEQIQSLEHQCLREQGVVASFVEYIPASTLPRLTATILGLAALLAAAFLTASRLLLRRRTL